MEKNMETTTSSRSLGVRVKGGKSMGLIEERQKRNPKGEMKGLNSKGPCLHPKLQNITLNPKPQK